MLPDLTTMVEYIDRVWPDRLEGPKPFGWHVAIDLGIRSFSRESWGSSTQLMGALQKAVAKLYIAAMKDKGL